MNLKTVLLAATCLAVSSPVLAADEHHPDEAKKQKFEAREFRGELWEGSDHWDHDYGALGNLNSLYFYRPIFSWHESSAYIFVRSGGALKFVEIDNRQPMNFQTLSSAAEGSYYDERERQLYLLSGGSLYRADME